MYSKKSMYLLAAVALAAMLTAGAAGCGSSGGNGPGKISLVDDAGRTLVLDKPVERVVSLAPSNTEIIYAIGGEKKLVGVTTYCDYPAAAKKMPNVGDFATPNVERIASRDPQVVFATSGLQDSVVESLGKLDIKVFVVEPKSFGRLYEDIKAVGKVLGLEGKADEEADKLKKQVGDIESKARGLSKPRVFFEIYNQPLMTAGKGTLIDLMIGMAGGLNIGSAAGPEFPQFSEEQLLQDNPDIYVAPKGTMTDPADISKRPGYQTITAVKDGKVFVVEDNLFFRAGPRLVDGLEQLAEIIHPEVFKK